MACAPPSLTPFTILDLAATVIPSAVVYPPDVRLCWRGDMLFKVAFVLLLVWLLGMAGLYQIGELLHALLLIGLMLLMMAFIKARDAARRRVVDMPDRR
jgi:hypothetical protein